jgi:hypothetical protein
MISMTPRCLILVLVAALFSLVGGDQLHEIKCKGKTNNLLQYHIQLLTCKQRNLLPADRINRRIFRCKEERVRIFEF